MKKETSISAALLILVFMKPLWQRYGRLAQKSSVRQVVIMLDHSMSMEYEAYGISPRRRAIQEATKIINGLGEGDMVNVLLVEEAARPLFLAPTADHAELRSMLQSVKVGYTRADFSAANRSAAEQLAKVRLAMPAGRIQGRLEADLVDWLVLTVQLVCEVGATEATLAEHVFDLVASPGYRARDELTCLEREQC